MAANIAAIHAPKIKHDGLLSIATGRSRDTRQWRNEQLLWSQLLAKLSKSITTNETLAEYQAMAKAEQDRVKDVGGFVGGELKEGRRKLTHVVARHLLTLDADNVTGDLWASLDLLGDYAVAVYSTHSHTQKRPRLRLVIPLKRPVTADEYQAISRRIAADLGINQFDPTTFEPHRLMYWPSSPSDVEPFFKCLDLPWLDPDAVLNRYTDWRDPSYWPEPEKATKARSRQAEKAEDPHEKTGIVGAFCRTYNIEEAINTFLADVYTPAGEGRYTFVPGTTTGGLVVYDDGKFAYSHHGTDPVSGRLVNSFDLVRLHKFGGLDDEAAEGTPVIRLPSYKAMAELATKDVSVVTRLDEERAEAVAEDFGKAPIADNAWLGELERTKEGEIKSTRHNILLILENDPLLKGRMALNEFTNRPGVKNDLPWRPLSHSVHWQDRDDAGLRYYLERRYGINNVSKTHDAFEALMSRHRFHPVRDYLESLEWDGVPRLETLLIDCMGADDSAYVRAVTRKALAAAVARVMEPGCKFDHVLVLVGSQGIGKSLLINRLGREWYSDSLTVMQGKEAYEQLHGVWIMELGELAAMRRAEIEAVKHFITKQEDTYRVAYGRQTSTFPRQCIFIGTTNESAFLKDATGNRRFWPVQCFTPQPSKALLTFDVDQIWAEAVGIYKQGEALFLKGSLAKEALEAQEAHRDESERAGAIREFLDLPLPSDWEEWDLSRRREYLHGSDFGGAPKTGKPRDRVCVMEIWEELFLGDPKHLTRAQAGEIHDVLKTTPGWERAGKLRFGTHYGVQLAYVRSQELDVLE